MKKVNNMKIALFALVALSMSCLSARADLLVTIGNGSSGTPIELTPGVEALIPVYLSRSTTGATLDNISGFSLSFDFGAIGNVLNGAGISDPFPDLIASSSIGDITNSPMANLSLSLGSSLLADNPDAIDLVINGQFSSPLSVANGVLTKAFDFKFTPTAAATGVYIIGGVADLGTTNYAQNGLDSTSVAFSNGSFSVTAVPEPSSLALLGVVGIAGVAVKRFRKKKTSVTVAAS